MNKIPHSPKARSAFTLIEMIGVLAIIAILAVVIAPKVFDTIRSSRVNATIVSMDTIKTATADFVADHGVLPTTNNKSRLDDLLIEVGLLEERFSSKMGQQGDIYATKGASWSKNSDGSWSTSGGKNQNKLSRIISRPANSNSPETANGRNYRLRGSDDLPSGSRVVSAVIESVPEAEARELSARLDGDEFTTDSGADGLGKVVYRDPGGNGITDVYVYLLHQ